MAEGAPQSGLSEAAEREERFAAYEEAEPSAPVAVAEELPNTPAPTRPAPTLTLEEAGERLGPGILQALESKFNGSLAEIRATDEKDQFFQ